MDLPQGYDSLPPIDKFKFFDGAMHLKDQESGLATDPLNTLCSMSALHGQLRVCSLNVNGLTIVKLGLLLTYMELNHLDVLALQDTRLSATESSTMSSIIRKKYLTNIQVRCAQSQWSKTHLGLTEWAAN